MEPEGVSVSQVVRKQDHGKETKEWPERVQKSQK